MNKTLTSDLFQRCRELLELKEKGQHEQRALRALADTYDHEIPHHVRRSMAESETYVEAMQALLATQQPEPRDDAGDWNTPCAGCSTPRACQYDGCRSEPRDEVTEFLRDVAGQTPEKPDHWNACGQCERNSDRARDLLDGLAAPQPTAQADAPAEARPTSFHFHRFVDGQKMAEDVLIERERTLDAAIRAAVRSCPKRPPTVLVHAPALRGALADARVAQADAREGLTDEQHAKVRLGLTAAKHFIANGIALGFIRMPDADCPDPAHNTPKLIDEALALLQGGNHAE